MGIVGIYERFLLPRLVHFACSGKSVNAQRAKVAPAATGRVLEIGFGSGLNLPFYDRQKVRHIWALEPSAEMWALAVPNLQKTPLPVEYLKAQAEQVPLPDQVADTVLLTFSLCTVSDVHIALAEMSRVLKPQGRLVFCEHGQAPDRHVQRVQDRLTPFWRFLFGGCHLNRPIPSLIERGGFEILELSAGYIPGWKPGSFNFWGQARRSGGR
jgi:SAM-dependent methyltransferase